MEKKHPLGRPLSEMYGKASNTEVIKRAYATDTVPATTKALTDCAQIQSACREHHAKVYEERIEKKYQELLKADGPRRELKPGWTATDRFTHLFVTARHKVAEDHSRRLEAIEKFYLRKIDRIHGFDLGNNKGLSRGAGK